MPSKPSYSSTTSLSPPELSKPQGLLEKIKRAFKPTKPVNKPLVISTPFQRISKSPSASNSPTSTLGRNSLSSLPSKLIFGTAPVLPPLTFNSTALAQLSESISIAPAASQPPSVPVKSPSESRVRSVASSPASDPAITIAPLVATISRSSHSVQGGNAVASLPPRRSLKEASIRSRPALLDQAIASLPPPPAGATAIEESGPITAAAVDPAPLPLHRYSAVGAPPAPRLRSASSPTSRCGVSPMSAVQRPHTPEDSHRAPTMSSPRQRPKSTSVRVHPARFGAETESSKSSFSRQRSTQLASAAKIEEEEVGEVKGASMGTTTLPAHRCAPSSDKRYGGPTTFSSAQGHHNAISSRLPRCGSLLPCPYLSQRRRPLGRGEARPTPGRSRPPSVAVVDLKSLRKTYTRKPIRGKGSISNRSALRKVATTLRCYEAKQRPEACVRDVDDLLED
ncbi:hypothetical protein JCM11641_001864 [Rhodosporidiobolus odoratus]